MEAAVATEMKQDEPIRARRTRTYKKRVHFKRLPKPAIAVRELWNSASEEEKRLAHQRCVTMLELWLGSLKKGEAMERLGVPALRLWQMSQSALSGMLAGLLKQPRTRGERSGQMDPQRDSKKDAKRVLALEKENEILRSLVNLLRGLPVNRDVKIDPESLSVLEHRPVGKKRRRTSTEPRSATDGRTVADRAGKASARPVLEDRRAPVHDGENPPCVEGTRAQGRSGRDAAPGGASSAQP